MDYVEEPYHEIDDGSIKSFVMRESYDADEPLLSIYKIRGQCDTTDMYILYNLMTAESERVEFQDLCRHYQKVNEKNLDRIYRHLIQAEVLYELLEEQEWTKEQ